MTRRPALDAEIRTLVARPGISPVISRRQATRALRFARSALAHRLPAQEADVVTRQMLHHAAQSAPTRTPAPGRQAGDHVGVRPDLDARTVRPATRALDIRPPRHLLLRRAWFTSVARLDEPDGCRFRYQPSFRQQPNQPPPAPDQERAQRGVGAGASARPARCPSGGGLRSVPRMRTGTHLVGATSHRIVAHRL